MTNDKGRDKQRQPVDQSFESLLEYLKRMRGFDFTGYKRSSLMRRVNKRMSQIPIDDYADYIDYLEAHPGEFAQLFNTILINVTSFFRDVEAWEFLRREFLPDLVARHGGHGAIRIWCAGWLRRVPRRIQKNSWMQSPTI